MGVNSGFFFLIQNEIFSCWRLQWKFRSNTRTLSDLVLPWDSGSSRNIVWDNLKQIELKIHQFCYLGSITRRDHQAYGFTMGIDHTSKQHKRSGHRTAPKSDNVYLKLLVKLYTFLARMFKNNIKGFNQRQLWLEGFCCIEYNRLSWTLVSSLVFYKYSLWFAEKYWSMFFAII